MLRLRVRLPNSRKITIIKKWNRVLSVKYFPSTWNMHVDCVQMLNYPHKKINIQDRYFDDRSTVSIMSLLLSHSDEQLYCPLTSSSKQPFFIFILPLCTHHWFTKDLFVLCTKKDFGEATNYRGKRRSERHFFYQRQSNLTNSGDKIRIDMDRNRPSS